MQIYEEYFKRHSIRVPLVKHTLLGFLFLRELSDAGLVWTIVSINWNEPTYHPGSYIIRFLHPVHDTRCMQFEETSESRSRNDLRLQWDEYEDFFLDWSSKCKKSLVVSSHKEIVLMAWEMFVHTHDTYFARSFRNVSNLLFSSLDFTSSIDERYSNYLMFMKVVDSHIDPFKSWKLDSNRFIRNYSYWLVDLIQKNGC